MNLRTLASVLAMLDKGTQGYDLDIRVAHASGNKIVLEVHESPYMMPADSFRRATCREKSS